jgi:type VII secretion protein EccB
VASRQNQLHAYQFAVQRTVSALVIREPDPGQAPLRRVGGSGFASAMIAILALAAVGVYGLVVAGGNNTWRKDGTVVVERESGATFVYIEGKLHPVLNYASALLIAGNTEAKSVSVSRKSLAGAPRGTPLGIAGAPDSLVPRNRLLRGAWTVCTSLVRQPNGALAPESVLMVGAQPTRSRPLGREQALFVRDGTGTEFMVWTGHKYRVPDTERQVVHDAIVVSEQQVASAAPAWMNVLPAGPDLRRPAVPTGGTSPVDGYRIGDVVTVQTPGVGSRSYVVLADGLAALTRLQANLLISGRAAVSEQTPAWFAGQPRSKTDLSRGGNNAGTGSAPPESPPAVVPPPDEQRAACAVVADASGVPVVLVDAAPPATAGTAMTGSRSSGGSVLADRVLIEPGRGAVVEAVASAGAESGTVCVVTDVGVAFPVSAPAVIGLLGYGGITPNRLPSAVVALLPPGQALDPEAARAPATVR